MNDEKLKKLIEANKKYWGKRAEQRLITAEQKTLRLEKDLKKQFGNVYKNIEAEISKLYFKYASDTGLEYADVVELLNKSERKEFQKTLEYYIEKSNDENFRKEHKNYLKGLSTKSRIERLEALKANINFEVNNLYSKCFRENTQITFDDILKDTYYSTIYDIQSLIGYTANFSKISPHTLEVLLEYPWSGKNYSQKIWGHINNFENKLEDVLTSGIIQGKSNQKMASELEKATKTAYKNAIRLIRTETNYILSEATHRAYKECNVEKYVYLATLDLKTSDICRKLDRKVFDEKDRKIGLNCNPMHPHCRSTTISFFADLEEYDEIKSMTYKDWYEKNVSNNPEMLRKEKIVKKESADKRQYEKYKNTLGKDTPKTFEDFQNLKYNNVDGYNELKKNFRVKNRELKKQEKGLSSSDNNENHNKTAPKFVEKINIADATKKTEEYMLSIANEPLENAYVIIKSGKTYKFTGDESSVNPLKLKTALKDSIIIHNHPSSETEYSFSKDDIELLINHQVKALYGIDDKYIYCFENKGCTYDDFDKNYIDAKIAGENRTKAMETYLNKLHNINIELSKRVNIDYIRRER